MFLTSIIALFWSSSGKCHELTGHMAVIANENLTDNKNIPYLPFVGDAYRQGDVEHLPWPLNFMHQPDIDGKQSTIDVPADGIQQDQIAEIWGNDYNDHIDKFETSNNRLTRTSDPGDIPDIWPMGTHGANPGSPPMEYGSQYSMNSAFMKQDYYSDLSKSMHSQPHNYNNTYDGKPHANLPAVPRYNYNMNGHPYGQMHPSYYSNHRKSHKGNACRLYLEFLKYAFTKLNEEVDYSSDYQSYYSDVDQPSYMTGQQSFASPYGNPYFPENADMVISTSNNRDSFQSRNFEHHLDYQDWPTETVNTESPYKHTQTPAGRGMPSTVTPPGTTFTYPWFNATDYYVSTINQTVNRTASEQISTEHITIMPDLNSENFVRTTSNYGESKHTQSVTFESSTTVVTSGFNNTLKWMLPENHKNPTVGYGNIGTTTATPETDKEYTVTVITPRTFPITRQPELRTETSMFPTTFPTSVPTTGPTMFPSTGFTTGPSTVPSTLPSTMSSYYQERQFTDSTPNNSDKDCNDKMLPCPDTVNVTYPLNGYCNRFVSCESGVAVRRTCADGLHFNIITKSCDLPHNSFCNYVCAEPNGYYGIPGDCGGYFVCKNSVPEYRMCPPKMFWNKDQKICTFSDSSVCPMKCNKDNEVKYYEGDCQAYIVCIQGIPYYHKCPPNTKFDRAALTCQPANLSTCRDDPRLMTRFFNPNSMCRDIYAKMGTDEWCDYYRKKQQQQNL